MPDDGYCRPLTTADLIQLIQSLNKENVPYLLIGGHALNAHGYYRATTDNETPVILSEANDYRDVGGRKRRE